MRTFMIAVASISLAAGAAQAGDLSLKDSDEAGRSVWSGPYIGLHVGYGRGDNDWRDFTDPVNQTSFPGPDASYDISGALAGGQIGYNWQRGRYVFGLEADVSWSDIDGAGADIVPPFTFAPSCLQQTYCKTSIEAFGTLTGRAGFTIDNALIYAKGGAAWARETHETGYKDQNFPAFQYWADPSQTRWGWTVGAGLELAFGQNWSLRAEYNYIDLGSDRIQFTYAPAQTFGASAESEIELHTFNVGLNYHFGN
jgi:outer membrane immunogenic protein